MRPQIRALGEVQDRLDEAGEALLGLLRSLSATGYRFVTPTPATHARVLENRGAAPAADLRDVFGWSLPFDPATLDPAVLALLERFGEVERGPLWRSRIRVSSLGETLLIHSAFPTSAGNAVFFGPDSYRFRLFLQQRLGDYDGGTAVDLGAGTGVGGLTVGAAWPEAPVVLTDINPLALRYARVNAAHAGLEVDLRCGPGLSTLREAPALVVANPPFIACPSGRAYRSGGAMLGAQLSLDWAQDCAVRLRPGGRLLLYTGVAIVGGQDRLCDALRALAAEHDCGLDYDEIDPDIFGEELDKPPYRGVDRIAAVGAVLTRR